MLALGAHGYGEKLRGCRKAKVKTNYGTERLEEVWVLWPPYIEAGSLETTIYINAYEFAGRSLMGLQRRALKAQRVYTNGDRIYVYSHGL